MRLVEDRPEPLLVADHLADLAGVIGGEVPPLPPLVSDGPDGRHGGRRAAVLAPGPHLLGRDRVVAANGEPRGEEPIPRDKAAPPRYDRWELPFNQGPSPGRVMSARRVFLSHTSLMARVPEGRNFVQAAKDAALRAGLSASDMQFFAADDRPPAAICQDAVRACDIYIGLFG